MPARADRERDARGAGGSDGRGDVVGVGGVGDRRRAAIDRAVPACARVVVAGVTGFDEAPDEAVLAQRRGEWRGGGGGLVLMPGSVAPAAPAGVGGLPHLHPLSGFERRAGG